MKPVSCRRTGIVGMPPLAVIKALEEEGCQVFDLDEPIVTASIETASPYLPRVYCAILRTVVTNSLKLNLDAIYIDVGPGKCDCAEHTATVLEDSLPKTKIIRTKNQDKLDFGTPLCTGTMPLIDKMLTITASVRSSAPHPVRTSCQAAAGFWGVPPRDFSILTLFPDSTHIYGWTRCMENKTPDNIELEKFCDPTVPTVFFAQSFCAKTALAHHLANNHPLALFLDCDVTAGASAKAKIQAFFELNGVSCAAR